MPDYRFFIKGRHTVVLEKSDTNEAALLTRQGYTTQFEEVSAPDKKQALARFMDIRKEKQIDSHHFLAGTGAMPWIGVLTALAGLLIQKFGLTGSNNKQG